MDEVLQFVSIFYSGESNAGAMTSLEPHNLTLAPTHNLLQYNASKLGDDDGDPWGPTSPPPFYTQEVPEGE